MRFTREKECFFKKLIHIHFKELGGKNILKKIIFFIFIIIFINATSCYAVPTISAKNAIAIEVTSGRIIYEKDAYKKVPIASTTKIMTAIIAIENNLLTDTVIVSNKASWTGGSSVNLKEGDEILLSELLYGLMLNSGNDAAVAIAEHTSGNVEEFSKLMNEKAKKIGALNTNFVTPHGLDTDNHYSTAYDMAIITKYALKNPIIKKLVSTSTYTMKFKNGKTKNLTNTNPLLSFYEGATGVKTGYTGLAGKCLVASAKRENIEIIAVLLGDPSSKARRTDSAKILDFCFNNYKLHDLKEIYPLNFHMQIQKGVRKEIKPIYENSLIIPLTEEEKNNITVKKILEQEIMAPIEINQPLGTIQFILKGEVIGEIKILAPYSIPRLNILDYLSKIGLSFLDYSNYIN